MCVSSCRRELDENQKPNKTADNWPELPRLSGCSKISKGEEEEKQEEEANGTGKGRRRGELMALM